MIQIIAFSFNRAMQLDILLSSLILHWKSPDYKIDVVYNYSSEDFGAGYAKLADEYKDKNVFLHKEDTVLHDKITICDFLCIDNIVRLYRQPKLRKPKTNFRSIILEILKNTSAENVMFLTDDSMFVSDINLKQTDLDWVNTSPRDRQFSLRLGKGVSTLPKTVEVEGDYCNWDMYDNKGNWGYPFSVDAHIYNKKFVSYLLKRYLFVNPNTLEMNIVGSVRRAKQLAQGRCYADIKMLTFPINIVQNTADNLSQNVSVEMLNKRYLEGDRLMYVVDEEFNATKQYVRQIQFTDENGSVSILSISNELTRPNACLSVN